MKLTTYPPDLRMDFTGKVEILLPVCEESKSIVNELLSGKADKYSVEIKPYRKNRSLDANAYLWVLLQKLAVALKTTKEELYRGYIRRLGSFEIMPVKCDKADFFVNVWQDKGLGWCAEVIGDSKLDGYKNVICYYGSSVYDTKEMSVLIDEVVSDCRDQGIETMTKKELEALMESWNEKHIAG